MIEELTTDQLFQELKTRANAQELPLVIVAGNEVGDARQMVCASNRELLIVIMSLCDMLSNEELGLLFGILLEKKEEKNS